MALNDIYSSIFSFEHPNGDGSLSYSMHYRLDEINDPRTEPELCSDLAAELKDITESVYIPVLSADMEFIQMDVLNITQDEFGASSASGATGSLSEQCVGIRSAPLISKRTGLRGRSRRGRMFLMSPTETQQSGGELESAFKTVLFTYISALLNVTVPETNVYQSVVWSAVLAESFDLSSFITRDRMGSIIGRQKVS